MVLKIAHRGGSALRPENTLEAFDFALRFDIDGVECDVHLCADGIPIVFHDDTLERCTNGKGKITDVSFEYLRSLKICRNCQIPTLEETLCLIRNREKATLFLEIKPKLVVGTGRSLEECYESYPEIDTKVADMLLANSMVTSTTVISFDWQILEKIRKKNPSITTGMLVSLEMANLTTDEGITSLLTEAKKIGCRWINMDAQFFLFRLDEEVRSILSKLKNMRTSNQSENNFLIGVWTVNDYIDMKRLVRLGVDAITSDRPELLSLL